MSPGPATSPLPSLRFPKLWPDFPGQPARPATALCASLCVKTLPPSAHLTLGAREEHRPEDLSLCHQSPQSPEPPCSSRSALLVADVNHALCDFNACLLHQALGPSRAGLPSRALPQLSQGPRATSLNLAFPGPHPSPDTIPLALH